MGWEVRRAKNPFCAIGLLAGRNLRIVRIRKVDRARSLVLHTCTVEILPSSPEIPASGNAALPPAGRRAQVVTFPGSRVRCVKSAGEIYCLTGAPARPIPPAFRYILALAGGAYPFSDALPSGGQGARATSG